MRSERGRLFAAKQVHLGGTRDSHDVSAGVAARWRSRCCVSPRRSCETPQLFNFAPVGICVLRPAARRVPGPSPFPHLVPLSLQKVVEVEREIALLTGLVHPNIVRYLGTARDAQFLTLFMEYVPGGSVSALLKQFGPLRDPVVRAYTTQILTGLDYLHDRGCGGLSPAPAPPPSPESVLHSPSYPSFPARRLR